MIDENVRQAKERCAVGTVGGAMDDSRAIDLDHVLMKRLASERSAFAPFVDAVRRDRSLELCFRGSASPKRASIYFMGRAICDLSFGSDGRPRVGIETAHAVAMQDAAPDRLDELLDRLENKLGFDIWNSADELKYSTKSLADADDGRRTARGAIRVAKELMSVYLRSPDGRRYADRAAVQRAFSSPSMMRTRGGFFAYDLDFTQSFEHLGAGAKKNLLGDGGPWQKAIESKLERSDPKFDAKLALFSKNMSAPDMLAIRYDDEGEPRAIVFVDVKTSARSMTSPRSGAEAQMARTFAYAERPYGFDGVMLDFMDQRRREAPAMLACCAALGLRGLDGYEADADRFASLPAENMLLLCGGAIDEYESAKRDRRRDYRFAADRYACNIYRWNDDVGAVDDEPLHRWSRTMI